MFHLISGVVMAMGVLYLYARCLRPLRCSPTVKALCAAGIALAAFKLQVFRLLFGGSVVQELPYPVLIVSGWVYAVVILWVLLTLLWDVALGLARLPGLPGLSRLLGQLRAPGRAPRTVEGGAARRVAVLLTLACVLSAVGVWQAVGVPSVHRVTLRVRHLPPALEGLRMVQLSDLHISPLFRRAWTEAVVQRANALQPDIIVLTGDMIDGGTAERAADVAPLAQLRSRYGVYACLGNHEYYSGVNAWYREFTRLGITVLRNSHAVVRVGTERLVLGGVTDAVAPNFGEPGPDAARAFAGSPAGWRVLLAHRPSEALHPAVRGVSAQLSGHTHGGQVFPLSLLVAWFNGGFLSGEYAVGDTRVYVSRGAGLWGGFPVRLGEWAEIVEITLRGDGAGADTAR